MSKILILEGPNLNMLGQREKQIYGAKTLAELHLELVEYAKNLDSQLELEFFQSNREYELIEKLHSIFNADIDFIIFNPAAFTHTSVALRDAILAINLPFIEIHISNIYKREEFRQKSFFSDIALGVISGLGDFGYKLAIQAAINSLYNNKN